MELTEKCIRPVLLTWRGELTTNMPMTTTSDTGDTFYTCATISKVRGIGKKTAERFASKGIITLFDLLLHLPFRYIDKTRLTPLREIIPDGRPSQSVVQITNTYAFQGGRSTVLRCDICDNTGRANAVFFNVYPSLLQRMQPGRRVLLFGPVRIDNYNHMTFQHPQYTYLGRDELPMLPKTLTPVYHTCDGIAQNSLRKYLGGVLEQLEAIPLEELLPPEQNPYGMSLTEALLHTHHPLPQPENPDLLPEQLPEFQRLCLEELIAFQLSLLSLKKLNLSRSAAPICFNKEIQARFLKSLSFKLTGAQERTFREICADLNRNIPMVRMLHGDVGSGKTLVAMMACLQAHASGCQSVMLAPTELLALQHYKKFSALLSPLGIKIVILHSSQKKGERDEVLAAIADGSATIILGTHSVFQSSVHYHNLALAIIDEQHRFGVGQRIALMHKAPGGMTLHQLIMTATPIPRTQQMALYSDLDVSTLDELPAGRTPITTTKVSTARRAEVIKHLRNACKAGAQAYWVCPHIEDSEGEDCASATSTFEELRQALAPLRVGLLHGQLGSDEKTAVMNEFLKGRLSVLVATTIIEVGVDVPNANIMIIDSADKLGLAQLHQLRGRVGRGASKSYCLMIYNTPAENDSGTSKDITMQRLNIMCETTNGFKIAEEDLKLRGPGEVFGSRQSGFDVFRIADVRRDLGLAKQARTYAEAIAARPDNLASRLIARWFPDFKSE